jgi:tetratricopeptide (TPR) repeat protein
MAEYQFFFWEAMKALGIALLALAAAKAVTGLRATGDRRLHRAGIALYVVILLLAMWGAHTIGYDLAAHAYYSTAQNDLLRHDYSHAYRNAERAVRLRPAILSHWQTLEAAKLGLHQFESVLDDRPALQSLSKTSDEEDVMRWAVAHLYLGHYDQAIALTLPLVQNHRAYPLPYTLQGEAYLQLKEYQRAAAAFLACLQIDPTQREAVEGLAHAYFLDGDAPRAIAVLSQTEQQPFSPESRQRFRALQELYAQQ